MTEKRFDEQNLIRGLGKGDPSAFRTLYELYAPRLQAFAARMRCSREEADEVVQETFIRVWRHRHKIDPTAPFGTYVITIAKHLIYNMLKRASYREQYIRDMSHRLQQQNRAPVNERELQQLIGKAMTQLPDKCRQVFRKSRLEGYSNQQIAEELDISKSTVENQLNKALKIIRKCLESNGYRTTLVVWGISLITFIA